MLTVHRAIEDHAAHHADATALRTAFGVVDYRQLNAQANALARHLIDHGFRRGDRAVIAMPASPGLLIAELAVLKAGGAYARPAASLAYTVVTPFSVLRDGTAHGIDITRPLSTPVNGSPNLPILVRQSEPACVLADDQGALTREVSHADVASVSIASAHLDWSDDQAFEHWAVLMRGGTLAIPRIPYRFAA